MIEANSHFVAFGVGKAPCLSRMTRSKTRSKGTNIEVTNNGIACLHAHGNAELHKLEEELTSVAQRMVQKVKIAKHLFASCSSSTVVFRRMTNTTTARTLKTYLLVILNLPTGVEKLTSAGSDGIARTAPTASSISPSPRLSLPIICRHTVSLSQAIFSR